MKLNLPMTPAPKGSQHLKIGGALLNADFCRSVLGILLMRNEGKSFVITQADFDAVTGMCVLEGMDDDGNLIIALGHPEGKQS
jgi:hypothetical protein